MMERTSAMSEDSSVCEALARAKAYKLEMERLGITPEKVAQDWTNSILNITPDEQFEETLLEWTRTTDLMTKFFYSGKPYLILKNALSLTYLDYTELRNAEGLTHWEYTELNADLVIKEGCIGRTYGDITMTELKRALVRKNRRLLRPKCIEEAFLEISENHRGPFLPFQKPVTLRAQLVEDRGAVTYFSILGMRLRTSRFPRGYENALVEINRPVQTLYSRSTPALRWDPATVASWRQGCGDLTIKKIYCL